jgi:hypothetical protein
MKADWHISGGCWMGLLAGLVMGGTVFAQTATIPTQTSGSSSTLQTYQQKLGSLLQERGELISQGATQQQLQTWREQNGPQFAALQQFVQSLAQESALQPLPLRLVANIPPNASGTFADFLIAQATLANSRAQIHNQLLQSLPQNPTREQINTMMQEEWQQFQQQHGADFQLQMQRVQALAAQSASQPLRVPGSAVIPPNASPQLQAFLRARNTLLTARAQLWNQYLTADSAARQVAMQQWREQNAGRLEQLRELAQELSNSTSNQEGETQ